MKSVYAANFFLVVESFIFLVRRFLWLLLRFFLLVVYFSGRNCFRERGMLHRFTSNLQGVISKSLRVVRVPFFFCTVSRFSLCRRLMWFRFLLFPSGLRELGACYFFFNVICLPLFATGSRRWICVVYIVVYICCLSWFLSGLAFEVFRF